MKSRKKRITISLILILLVHVHTISVFCGNEDRAGQAGASELLIMPYARNQGWAAASTSSIIGLEAMYMNVAGTAFTNKIQVGFTRTDWLKGADVAINAFGLTTRVSDVGVMGISIMSMSFGDIDITTEDQPEGGIGKFTPSLLNLAFSYAHMFSNSIFGGILIKIISESIADNSAQGVALDAGIQYVTGERENIRFGIALRNVGPSMRFDGDGLSVRGNVFGSPNQLTLQQRSAKFELPSLLNIGMSYCFYLTEDGEHKITAAGTFVSNSFQKDNIIGGLEYNFNDILFLRTGFHYEEEILESMPERTTAYTGPALGASIQVPIKKEEGSYFSIDYGFRATNPYQGIHSLGAKFNF